MVNMYLITEILETDYLFSLLSTLDSISRLERERRKPLEKMYFFFTNFYKLIELIN